MHTVVSGRRPADAPLAPHPPLADGDICDVVIVGSGAGGMAAAAVAATKGLKVVVLEKAAVFGGTTAIAAGGTWVPCNAVAARAGVKDSREAALAYFRACAGEYFNEPLVHAYLDRSPEMIDYLERHTEAKFSYAVGRPDYHPDYPGASTQGRTIHPLPYDARELGPHAPRLSPPSPELTFLGLMIKPGPELRHFLNVFRSWHSTVYVTFKLLRHFRDLLTHGRAMGLSNGNALIARLARTAFAHGARVHTSVAAQGLVMEGGCVSGVRFRRVDAQGNAVDAAAEGTLRARRGVVLASGGFGHDVERRRQFFAHAPHGTEHWSPEALTNTGDGLRMAEAVGACIDAHHANAACWAPVSLVTRGDGRVVALPHLIDRQKPGFIAVTRNGERFVNEADSYHDFGRGLLQACAGEAEASCFLVADHRAVRRYGMGTVKPAPLPLGAHLKSGYLIRAATLDELARRCGIDAARLQATVREYNLHAERGEDPAFGRGGNVYNRYNGDPDHRPNACNAPIVRAPFYAVKIRIGELATFAGLAIDPWARVLGAHGTPIPGLYAAGNDAASVMGGDYLGGGSAIGPAMTFGYIAACDMARNAQEPLSGALARTDQAPDRRGRAASATDRT